MPFVRDTLVARSRPVLNTPVPFEKEDIWGRVVSLKVSQPLRTLFRPKGRFTNLRIGGSLNDYLKPKSLTLSLQTHCRRILRKTIGLYSPQFAMNIQKGITCNKRLYSIQTQACY